MSPRLFYSLGSSGAFNVSWKRSSFCVPKADGPMVNRRRPTNSKSDMLACSSKQSAARAGFRAHALQRLRSDIPLLGLCQIQRIDPRYWPVAMLSMVYLMLRRYRHLKSSLVHVFYHDGLVYFVCLSGRSRSTCFRPCKSN